MKTTVSRAKLVEVLDLCSRFVARNSTLPILENVYIKGNADSLIFRASDMEKHIEVEISANIDIEGHITVSAKKFFEYCKTIEDEDVTISIEENKNLLIIKSSNDNAKFRGISGNEYLGLPVVSTSDYITVDALQLHKGLHKVDFAISEKNMLPTITGALFRIKQYDDGRKLVFVGTDSFRLAEYKIAFFGDGADFSIIIPKNNLAEIKKVLEYYNTTGGVDVQIKHSDNLVDFTLATDSIRIHLVSLLIQGNFPEYDNENIMPTQHNIKAILDKYAVEKSIRKINVLTKDTNNYISIKLEGDNAIFESGEMDEGEAQTTISSHKTGDDVKFGLNGRYLSDVIRYIESSEINLGIVSHEKPIVVSDKDDINYRYIIRPIT